jgi:hypothetical protein
MKRSELNKIIREAIDEVLSEADISPAEKSAKDAEMKAIDAKIKALNVKKGDLASGREEITEDNIDELANVAVRYELNPDAAAADFTGKKARIVTAMQATEEPMSKMDIASELGYDKQNPINKDFMELVADGTIIPSGEQRAPRLTRPAAEPTAAAATNDYGIEGGVEGDMSDEEVDAMFAKVMKGDDEEPEAGEIEKTNVSGTQMSDDEFNAWMDYQELERRLANTKSNILKARKSRPTPGDIKDQSSDEVERLRALKKKLEDKIADIAAKFPSLTKGKGDAPEIENPEDEEPIDEWAVSRAQYYAGIKK